MQYMKILLLKPGSLQVAFLSEKAGKCPILFKRMSTCGIGLIALPEFLFFIVMFNRSG